MGPLRLVILDVFILAFHPRTSRLCELGNGSQPREVAYNTTIAISASTQDQSSTSVVNSYVSSWT